jgi:hypothetical protein
MKKLLVLLSGVWLLILLSGCTSVKRFKSVTWEGVDNSLVEVELFSAKMTDPHIPRQEKHLWDLSASAQTQLIQILHERYADNSQFIDALNHQYLSEKSQQTVDLTRKKLELVFTINKPRDYRSLHAKTSKFSPADRIEYLRMGLQIPGEYNLRFTHWNRFHTEYGEFEVADVSFSRSVDLDAEGVLGVTEWRGKGGINRTEEQLLRSRYLKLNGSLTDHSLVMEEEGTREIDLTGNVMADVSLRFKGYPERIAVPVFAVQGEGSSGQPMVETLMFMDLLVPRMEEAPDTLFALLFLEYIYRHVESGWHTYAEWDDHVEYYTGKVKKPVPLLLKKDYLPQFYCLSSEQNHEEAIRINTGTEKDYLLQFNDLSAANGFLQWLDWVSTQNRDSVSVGKVHLMFHRMPLSSEEIRTSRFQVTPVY